jgi:hypothetical protein
VSCKSYTKKAISLYYFVIEKVALEPEEGYFVAGYQVA